MWRNNQPAYLTENVAKQSAKAKNVSPGKSKQLTTKWNAFTTLWAPKGWNVQVCTNIQKERSHYSHGPIWFLFKQVFNLTIFSRLFFCLIAAFSRYVRYFSGSCFMRILYNLSLSAGVGLPPTPMADVDELPIRLATPQLPPTTGKKQSGRCTFWHFLPVSYRQLVNYAQCS